MSATLAAAAADIELTPSGDVVEWVRDAAHGEEANPLAVRDALLELARLNAEAEQIDGLRKQIVERYDEKKRTLAGRAAAIRDSLQVYAERYGKTSFPDVGGIHLTTRKAEAKVTDGVAFRSWLEVQGHDPIVEANTETVERFDAQAALGMVLDELALIVTAGGSIVDPQTGVDYTEALDGVEVVAETKSLAVRKS